MNPPIHFEQFLVCKAHNQRLVIFTNTLFNEVDNILVALVQIQKNQLLISGLQVSVKIENEICYVDLLNVATVSKKHLKPIPYISLQPYRAAIKAGIDLFIDGF